MQKFSKTWITACAVIAAAAWGFSYQAEAQSGSAPLIAPYNPESWVAPEYPARYLPPDAAPYKDIDGHHIHDYVEYLAGISRRYRDSGHPQYWGRIISSPAEHETADWIEKKFKEFGLADVHIQTVADPVPQWAPKSWDVSLMTTYACGMKIGSQLHMRSQVTWRADTPFDESPMLPPETDLESKTVLKQRIPARTALAELKREAELIPNQGMLINTVPMLEAQASSEIENIVTASDQLFQLEMKPTPRIQPPRRHCDTAIRCLVDTGRSKDPPSIPAPPNTFDEYPI